MFSGSKILVVDTTHGGVILAEKIKDFGGDVTALDIYRTIDPEKRKRLSKKGIKVKNEEKDHFSYDLIVSPIHSPFLNPIIEKRDNLISHHEITGKILNQLTDVEIIEITGVKGKTSIAYILAEMLKERNVLLSCSLGVYENGKRIGKGDITPANAISVLENSPGADIFISEVSLGFTGAAEINVFASLDSDYRIAGGKLSAVQSKLYTTRYIKNKILLMREDSYKRYRPLGVEVFTYETQNEKWMENVSAAVSALKCLGMEIKEIPKITVPGRMEYSFEDGWNVIRDINPAVDGVSLENLIKEGLKMKVERMVVVTGGKERSNCSGMDYSKFDEVIEKYNHLVDFYFVGEVGKKLSERWGNYIEEERMGDLLCDERGLLIVSIRGGI
ncbi:MAG: hypothetical protein ACXQT5_08460 [Candidatus Syntropharchaeia archaeon]